jgi:hypothetical protein
MAPAKRLAALIEEGGNGDERLRHQCAELPN